MNVTDKEWNPEPTENAYLSKILENLDKKDGYNLRRLLGPFPLVPHAIPHEARGRVWYILIKEAVMPGSPTGATAEAYSEDVALFPAATGGRVQGNNYQPQQPQQVGARMGGGNNTNVAYLADEDHDDVHSQLIRMKQVYQTAVLCTNEDRQAFFDKQKVTNTTNITETGSDEVPTVSVDGLGLGSEEVPTMTAEGLGGTDKGNVAARPGMRRLTLNQGTMTGGPSINFNSHFAADYEQIYVDVSRTRPSLQRFMLKEARADLFAVLATFCERNRVGYIQGMNEILAVFFSLEDTGSDLLKTYLLYQGCLRRYLPYILEDVEDVGFGQLQHLFIAFDLLLRYHRPRIESTLQKAGLSSQLYTVSWFVTIFARNLSVQRTVYLWDVLFHVSDPINILFFSLALVVNSETQILNTNVAENPTFMMELAPKNEEDIKELWTTANLFRANTPISYITWLDSYFYCPRSRRSKLAPAMTICPYEISSTALFISPSDLAGRLGLSLSGLNYVLLDCRPRAEVEAGKIARSFKVSLRKVRGPYVERILTLEAQGQTFDKAVLDPKQNEQLRDGLNSAFDCIKPLCTPNTHIVLIGSGFPKEDSCDLAPFSRFLYEQNVPHLSILKGGFNEIAKSKTKRMKDMIVDYNPQKLEAARQQRFLRDDNIKNKFMMLLADERITGARNRFSFGVNVFKEKANDVFGQAFDSISTTIANKDQSVDRNVGAVPPVETFLARLFRRDFTSSTSAGSDKLLAPPPSKEE